MFYFFPVNMQICRNKDLYPCDIGKRNETYSFQNLQPRFFAPEIYIGFFWDVNNTKCCIGLYIEFRQSFAKETFFYDEYFKS